MTSEFNLYSTVNIPCSYMLNPIENAFNKIKLAESSELRIENDRNSPYIILNHLQTWLNRYAYFAILYFYVT